MILMCVTYLAQLSGRFEHRDFASCSSYRYGSGQATETCAAEADPEFALIRLLFH